MKVLEEASVEYEIDSFNQVLRWMTACEEETPIKRQLFCIRTLLEPQSNQTGNCTNSDIECSVNINIEHLSHFLVQRVAVVLCLLGESTLEMLYDVPLHRIYTRTWTWSIQRPRINLKQLV
jgi:hypothetical protein